MRTYQHIIDTKAIKKVLTSFPDHWVIRELSERDYGTDLMIEIFVANGKDKNDHTTYKSSGGICNIQVKGTNKSLTINESSNSIHFSFEKKSLLYVERFPIPFFLVRVDASDIDTPTYFVWLQRYIKDVLDLEDPDWREKKEKSITIKIPAENTLPNGEKKIEKIASRIKYVEELIEYREIYKCIDQMLNGIGEGYHLGKAEDYQYLTSQVLRISRLYTLLSQNNSGIDSNSVNDLKNSILAVASGIKNRNTLLDYPYMADFERLSSEVNSTAFVENFVAANDKKKVY